MARHPRGERIRWLAATSIVAAICGVTALVRVWPVGSAPIASIAPSATPLAARALMLVDAPGLPSTVSVADRLPGRRQRRTAPIASAEPLDDARPPAIAVAESAMAAAAPAIVAVSEPTTSPGEAPVLASRRIDVVFIPVASAPVLAAEALPPSSRPFVELPAAAVTRVVTYAGRGIRSGVRATTAVVRAAF